MKDGIYIKKLYFIDNEMNLDSILIENNDSKKTLFNNMNFLFIFFFKIFCYLFRNNF